MRKLIAIILTIVMVIINVVGCSSQKGQTSQTQSSVATSTSAPAKQVTLNFWYCANDANPNDFLAKWMKANVEKFNEKYPNITIERTVVSDSTQYLGKLSSEIAANNGPDIFHTWLTGRLEPFVTAKRVVPLNDIVNKYPEMKAMLSDGAISLATFGDKFYALPTITSGEVIYYNKKIFAQYGLQPPKTYDDLKNIVEVCKKNKIIPMALGNDAVWLGSIPYMAYFQMMFGVDLYKSVVMGKNANFTAPEFIAAGKELQNMTQMGMFTPNANAVKPEESQASFKEGRAAMSFDGTWRMPVFYKVLKEDLGFFNFPPVTGGKGSSSVWLVNFDFSIAISSSSKYIDEAGQFLGFVFTQERQKELGEYGQLLATKGIKLEGLSQIAKDLNAAMVSSTYTYIPWDNPLGANIGNEFNKATYGIIGGKDPTEMFNRLNEAAKLEWVKK